MEAIAIIYFTIAFSILFVVAFCYYVRKSWNEYVQEMERIIIEQNRTITKLIRQIQSNEL